MRLAVIGLGMASQPHLAALLQLAPEVTVSGVFTRNEARRNEVAQDLGVKAYGNLQEICNDSAVDAALIITPPNARIEIVRELAATGKHILMEKPVERNLSNAREIVEICDAAGVTLGMVLQHRFRQGAQALTGMVHNGQLGKICVVRVTMPWWRDQSYYDAPGRGTYAQDGGGVLITQAVHILDLMLSLTGQAREVQALTRTSGLHQMEAEDFATAGLDFSSGAVGSVVATTASFPGVAESLEIDAEQASVRLVAGELAIYWRDGGVETIGELTTTGGGSDPMDFPCDWHRDLIRDFANSVKGGTAPRITGREALKVHQLIEAIERSSRDGQRVSVEVSA